MSTPETLPTDLVEVVQSGDLDADAYMHRQHHNDIHAVVKTVGTSLAKKVNVEPKTYCEFTGKTNGVPINDDAGNPWYYVTNGVANAGMTVISGKLTYAATGTSVAAGYAEQRLSGNITRIGALVTFSPYTTTGGRAAIVVWQTPIQQPAVPNAAIHLTVGPNGWEIGPFVSGVGTAVLRQGEFAVPLVADGVTVHEFEMTLDYVESSCTFFLPNGQSVTVIDSRIAQYAGPNACWEVYENLPNTDSQAYFLETWADTTQERSRRQLTPRSKIGEMVNAVPMPVALEYSGSQTVAVTTSTTLIDSTNLVLPCVFPASGKLLITLDGNVSMAAATNILWGVSVNALTGEISATPVNNVSVTRQITNGRLTARLIITGVAGSAVRVAWTHFCTGGATPNFVNGGADPNAVMIATPIS